MTDDELDPLRQRINSLVEHLTPAARKSLAGRIAKDVRSAQVRRIKANLQPPDGSAMTKRKLRSARMRDIAPTPTRRGERMFQRAARSLRQTKSAEHAVVGFTGSAARILRPHQYGLSDAVSRDAGAPVVRYPKRILLGFDDADRERIMDQVMDALGG